MQDIILLTDSYKFSHYKQYPPGTSTIFSYFESRGGDFPEVLFFGLQYYLKKYLTTKIDKSQIDYAEGRIIKHMGRGHFNRKGWEHIRKVHDGRLPLLIKAVPEGTVVPTGNVLMTIENTDPECWWLTNYVETLLTHVWYPCTVATQSREMRQTLLAALEKSGSPELIDNKLHDFGFRGVSSVETSGIGALAHLLNFKGTDNFAGVELAYDYYEEDMAGTSIPASEHSTITSWGKEHEVDALRNMLAQYPSGLVACVSDSFDIFKACSNLWGKELRDEVMNRDGTLVVRPDSGPPAIIVPAVLNTLGAAFGHKTNAKGYRVLPPQVRVIQGDGIDRFSLGKILDSIMHHGWSADNVAFGSGGGLLQKVNRDTQKFAFKCSSALVNGEWRDVFKQPVTDPGKKSKAGRIKLIHDGEFKTVREEENGENLLLPVFKDGLLINTYSLSEIRGKIT